MQEDADDSKINFEKQKQKLKESLLNPTYVPGQGLKDLQDFQHEKTDNFESKFNRKLGHATDRIVSLRKLD